MGAARHPLLLLQLLLALDQRRPGVFHHRPRDEGIHSAAAPLIPTLIPTPLMPAVPGPAPASQWRMALRPGDLLAGHLGRPLLRGAAAAASPGAA